MTIITARDDAVTIASHDSESLANLAAGHGAVVRHKYLSIRGAALTINTKQTLEALEQELGVELIPDRPVRRLDEALAGESDEVTAEGAVTSAR